MREIKKVKVKELKRNPRWARQTIDRAAIATLAESIKTIGQQVPIIIHKGTIYDGHYRVEATLLNGDSECYAMEFEHEPTEAELLDIPIHIDFCRSNLSTMERSDQLALRQKLEGLSVSALAKREVLSQPHTSKLLILQDLIPAGRLAFQSGKMEFEAAVKMAGATPEEQEHILKLLTPEHPKLNRHEVKQALRRQPTASEKKVQSASFSMPGQVAISMRAKDLTLRLAAEVVAELGRILKRALAEGLDIKTQQKVMADRSRPKKLEVAAAAKVQVQS